MKSSGRVVKVEIYGREYPIRASVENEEYIRAIARYVDSKMREIKESMKIESTLSTAILAALNISDELFTLQDERDRLDAEYHEKVKSYSEALDRTLSD